MFDEMDARKVADKWIKENLPEAVLADEGKRVTFAGRDMWRFELWLRVDLPGHGPIGPLKDIWVDARQGIVVSPHQDDVPALSARISEITAHPFANGGACDISEHLQPSTLEEMRQGTTDKIMTALTIRTWANSVFRATDARRFPVLLSDIYQCLGAEPLSDDQAAAIWRFIALLATSDIRKLQVALARH
jgi:hypothetical protein